MRMTRLFAALLCACLFLGAARARAQTPQTLKIATLAPEGSSWMKLFADWKAAVDKRTEGQVKIKFYAGGVAGDERDVVRKMRLGQMSGAAITAVGLGLIDPDVRVLEIPFMFQNEEELNQARNALDGEFRKKFEAKGYQFLAWGDVGPVRVMSNVPLRDKADLGKLKMWSWTDDPMFAKVYQRLGINAVPQGVPDLLPSLQTGLVDAFAGPPLAAVSFQWHSKIKYVTSLVVSYSIGALVLSEKAWQTLTPPQRAALTDESRGLSEKLIRLIRDDNASALKKMQALGIEVVPTPEPLAATIRGESRKAADDLEGKLFGRDFRARLEQLVASKRK
jgi:TRAP-type C4-dicarboxylate transport system substrate-binding protein